MIMSISSPDHAMFAATRWSTITQVASAGVRASSGALAELCSRYRYPVYAYMRRSGHPPEIALGIADTFLAHVQRDFGDRGPPSTQQFRRFLFQRLQTYLAGEWHETASDHLNEHHPCAKDLEARYERDKRRDESPDQSFQHGFAVEILLRAFDRLRNEAQQTGHAEMYETLAPFLAREPVPGQYDELARTLKSKPLTVVVALKRLRQRLHELASEELADTVSSSEDLAAEQQVLFAALQGLERS
jgi:RNA polymerase sigma-70 factor (ECF subfamily)